MATTLNPEQIMERALTLLQDAVTDADTRAVDEWSRHLTGETELTMDLGLVNPSVDDRIAVWNLLDGLDTVVKSRTDSRTIYYWVNVLRWDGDLLVVSIS